MRLGSHSEHLRSAGSPTPRECERATFCSVASSACSCRAKPGLGHRSGRLDVMYASVLASVQRYFSIKYTAATKAARETPSTEWMSTDSPASIASSTNEYVSSSIVLASSKMTQLPDSGQ